jgi:hypothetical protein
VYAEPIREQGPKTYPAMRGRVDAAIEREGAASSGPSTHARGVEPVPPFGPRPMADVLAALTGRRADETPPAGRAPLLSSREEAQAECDRANGVEALAVLHDATGSTLRVEHDREGGRFYVCAEFGAGEVECPVEVSPDVARGVASVLAAWSATVGESADVRHAAQVAVASIKQAVPVTADVENDGDRGPRRRTGREGLIDAAHTLPDEWVAAACWMLSRLPTLRNEVKALTLANAETVDRHAARHDDCDRRGETTAEHMAAASTWRAVLDVSRLLMPHVDVRRGGAR